MKNRKVEPWSVWMLVYVSSGNPWRVIWAVYKGGFPLIKYLCSNSTWPDRYTAVLLTMYTCAVCHLQISVIGLWQSWVKLDARSLDVVPWPANARTFSSSSLRKRICRHLWVLYPDDHDAFIVWVHLCPECGGKQWWPPTTVMMF